MPTLSVEKDVLFEHIGRSYTDTAFDELCFEFGIELDEITSEREEASKGGGGQQLSKKDLQGLSDTVIYKIDIPANRYDLLCVEGLSRALRVFLGDMEAPVYAKKANATSPITMTVQEENCAKIRPFIVCAILRDISLDDPQRYHSLMDLQDQLHRNLCRQRTLVAIGTHDLDTIQPPFFYDARAPEDISFVPLVPSTQTFTAKALLEHYETEVSCKHLKPYVPIIKDSSVYPVVLDANDTVLSLPPIINGHLSRISLNTKNVFIECTATDLTKANIVLDTMVTMFSGFCAEPFVIEPVTVQYVNAKGATTKTYETPLLSTREATASVDFCNSLMGINVTPDELVRLCTKMQLGPAQIIQEDGKQMLQVTVPPTRSDILHAVDIAEDIGIAYGYNNIVKRVPATSTVGGEQPMNHFTDLLREEIARAGYTETLTHGLCSKDDNFSHLRRPETAAVALSNPANVEYQIVRTTLLPGLLKTIQHHRSASFAQGMKVFEISDVVLVDPDHVMTDTRVGTKNARRIAAAYSGPTAGFEIVHGLVDRILLLTEVGTTEQQKFQVPSREGWSYAIAPHEDDGLYFAGRAARVILTNPHYPEGKMVGSFGVVHPEVLGKFDIPYPTSCLELDLEAFL